MKLKELDSRLPRDHADIVLDVLGIIKKSNISKYAYKACRDKLYLEGIKLYEEEHLPAQDAYRKKLTHFAEKLVAKQSPRSFIESFSNLLFLVFTLLSIFIPIIYGLGFLGNETRSFYSQSIYLYSDLKGIFYSFLYGALATLIALILQKLDNQKKVKTFGIIFSILVVIGIALFILSNVLSEFRFKLNFIILETVLILLTVGFYFIEDHLSKKVYNPKN